MNIKHIFLIVIIAALVLVGCSKENTPVTEEQTGGDPNANSNLDTGYRDAIDTMNQLILGTFELEGSADAVTPAQAKAILPLWQVIQSGSLQGADETAAVLKQIKGQMTESQMTTIAEMQLTNEDMRVWMQEQGIRAPTGAAPGGQGGPGAMQNMSEEERAKMREEFQDLDPEARATRMAEMGIQAPGEGQGQRGQNGDSGGMPSRGQMAGGNFMLQPLVDLLTERAAQ